MSRAALEPGDTLDGFVIDARAACRLDGPHLHRALRAGRARSRLPDGDEGAAHGPGRRPRDHRRLRDRTPPAASAGRAARAPLRGGRRSGGRSVSGHRTRARPHLPGAARSGVPARAGSGRPAGHCAGAGLPQPASAERGASGPEARQRDVARWRHGRSAGLRAVAPRRASRSAGRRDAPADRNPCLHVAGAGARHSRRLAQRPVRHRRHALRDADRRIALRRPEDGGRPAPALVDGPGAAPAPPARDSRLAAGGGVAPAGAPGRAPLSVGQAPGVRSRESRPGGGRRARRTPARHALAPAPAPLAARGRPAVPTQHHAVAPDRRSAHRSGGGAQAATSATARCTRCGRPARARSASGPARAWPASR